MFSLLVVFKSFVVSVDFLLLVDVADVDSRPSQVNLDVSEINVLLLHFKWNGGMNLLQNPIG